MIKSMCGLHSKWLICLLVLFSHWVKAQTESVLSLDSCFELAKQNYPLVKQYDLIEKTKEYSLANAQKAYLPQFHVSGQASYQSEVTQIPVSLPGMDIPNISKEQYKLYTEASQSITDLFTLKDQKEYINVNSELETQKTAVELYKLRERMYKLYFGILLIDAQIKQVELQKNDVQIGIEQTNVAISNGVALKSIADNLKAELLRVDQQIIGLNATRKGYADMLSLFIGMPIPENAIFERPPLQRPSYKIRRPELRMFDLQRKSFDIQRKLITAKNLPRLSVFFQAGFGRPGLNMLDNDFQDFYIGGLRLNWNLTGFYTAKNEKKILALNQSSIEVQRESFLFNTRLMLKQQNAEIGKVQELIEKDKNIVTLLENVKKTTQNQLQYGTATTNDYLIAVNAEAKANKGLILHEIQLLMAVYSVQATSGNQ